MSIYLDRYAHSPLNIKGDPITGTGLIVVIPVFNETNLLDALNSLTESTLPPVPTEVLIIINRPEGCESQITAQNNLTFQEVNEWISSNSKAGLIFYVTQLILPKKYAGVGLARKAGMDEATRRFEELRNELGIIVCYDADCTCDINYLSEIYEAFSQNKLKGASIYFEHKVEHLTEIETEGILQYELHLRYYVNGLRKAGYPYAFHAIGSSMAVRVDIYKKAGGMNKRKAGEDFHFLHKVIPYEKYEEINSTSVFPSARISNRVPFGTGKAMNDWIKQHKSNFYTYHPQIFKEIGELLKQVPAFYKNSKTNNVSQKCTPAIQAYLQIENFNDILIDINRQSTSLTTFLHRWFAWFNGLRALHLVHYLRDNRYNSIPVNEAASQLFQLKKNTTIEMLKEYRAIDKKFKATQINLKHLYSEHL